MLVNGALLRVFGDDIVVGRALGAVTALAAAAILFWVGSRLRDKNFGFLCAAAFLVYPETVMNFRWVRSHPMAGTFALASCAFLVRYLQEKRLRDVVWAGVFCSLATATHYYTAPLILALVATVTCINWRHSFVAAVTAGAYGVLFVLWYVLAKGGVAHLLEQVHRVGGMTGGPQPTMIETVWHWIVNLGIFCFNDRIIGTTGTQFIDLWPALAAVGIVLFPVARFRKWIALWVLALMAVVFKKQDNVPLFFYPATLFLPLMALGVAGTLAFAGQFFGRRIKPAAVIIPLGVLAAFGLTSLYGSWNHFRTKIDIWTQQQTSVPSVEKLMAYVNEQTTAEDFVLVPKQIYWLVKNARKSMLSHCVTYEGRTNDAWPVPIPRDLFWFDCHWQKAKYLVLASGVTRDGRPRGIDLIYTRALAGVQEIVDGVLQDKWPVVFTDGRQSALAPVGAGKQWPVVVDGEYMVLANPRFLEPGSK
jgi:uncharacterized membrane protein